MKSAQLKIKNEKFSKIIDKLLSEKNGVVDWKETTMQEAGELLIGEYARDIISSGCAVDVELDFSYDTLTNLPIAVASCYRRNKLDNIQLYDKISDLSAYDELCYQQNYTDDAKFFTINATAKALAQYH